MGRYVVEGRLGAGGMAEVFRARQLGAEGFARPVALKRMSSALSHDETFAEMFIEEARLAALLQHPNIVQVLDFDRDERGTLFLAMELVDGSDLRRILDALRRSGRRMPPSIAAFVAAELLKALAYAHELEQDGKQRGLVHRDVSPHNCLVSRAGAVKLADFGIAKATATAALSQSGVVRGKVAYMAPEQARGDPVDARSDLFALGVVLYEMLAGERPFEGATEAETLARLLSGRFAPLGARVPDAPADLVAVASRLIEVDRAARFASAHEVLGQLLECRAYPKAGAAPLAALVRELVPLSPSPVGAWTRSLNPPKRRLLRFTAILAVGSALAAVAVWMVPRHPRGQPLEPPTAGSSPPEPTPDARTLPDASEAGLRRTDAGRPERPSLAPVRRRQADPGSWEVPLRGESPDEVPITR